MREKLIEILKTAPFGGKILDYWWFEETVAKFADHLLANGVTFAKDTNVPTNWIPVTERLPEEVLEESWDEKPHTASALVLVAVRDDCDRRFVADDITFDGEWCNYPSPDFEVTHWMPLPELPKLPKMDGGKDDD